MIVSLLRWKVQESFSAYILSNVYQSVFQSVCNLSTFVSSYEPLDQS